MPTPLNVAVLYGGLSAERDVSLVSGKAVAEALTSLGHHPHLLDVDASISEQLKALTPDVAFNALHGQYGEDGCVQGMLEILGIPYTHSGVLASALAMDKPMAKHIFRQAGIPTPGGQTLALSALTKGDPMARPYVIKPVAEGSSVGVTILFDGDDMPASLMADTEKSPDMLMLIEPYIAGREIQVAVLGDRALGAIEIRTDATFYDYEAKYTDGKAEHIMPAPLDQATETSVLSLALKAHQALGCKGLTRSDFRLDDTKQTPGARYLLEVNTQPGMTPLSLAPEIAAHAGISFTKLVNMLIDEALDRR